MKFHLIIFIIFLSKFSYGQENTTNYFDSNYYFQLEKIVKEAAEKSRIIGLGEATHGTKEFGIIKADIVKLLVTKYGFKNFVLENGYIHCLVMNEYIQGKELDSNTIFRNISWPWATKDFLDLLHWMKNYNLHQNLDKKITIYGTDICSYPSYASYEEQVSTSEKFPLMKSFLDIYKDSSKSQKEKLQLLNVKKKELKDFSSKTDSLLVWNYFTSVYAYTLSGGKRMKYREENLEAMMNGITDVSPENSKFIIWAHNGHVSKKSTHRKSMGYFLNKKWGTHYANIGFDFYQGKFRANDLDKPFNIDRMTTFEVDSLSVSSVKYITKAKNEITFISLKNASGILPKKFLIRDMGAAYSNNTLKERKHFFTEKISRNQSFDYLIIIPKSSPNVYYRNK